MRKFYLCFLLLLSIKAFTQTNPAVFDLSSGNYSFTSWSSSAAAGTYPPNMIFHFTNDPTGGSYNPNANGTANFTCAYNLGSRNRVNGQNANGFSFIATSSAQYDNCSSGSAASTRFMGAAVLGLNSTGRTNIQVSWTGRTLIIADDDRVMGVRLQYRTTTSGNWTDVPGPVQYSSTATTGSAAVPTATLPAACENQASLFLRWVYISISGSNGTRPQIGVDEISVTSASGANNLSFAYSNTTTAALNPPYITGTINDALDPAKVDGIITEVKDNGTGIASTDYTLTASSSNTTVVPNANVAVTKANGLATIKVTPAAVGYADITLTLTKGSFSRNLVINYAASQSASANARWMTGISDASAAIALDDDYAIIANDETNLLYVYKRDQSGLPVTSWDFNQGNNLVLTDGSTGNWKEVDVEAGVKSIANTGRTYWLGSMSNSSSFNNKPNRNRLFAVTATGTGAATSFANVGYYSNLRQRLITWGDGWGYNFTASAADGMDPKLINGFNAEGMVFGPDNTTLYIGFRAPLVPTASRTKAVIAPIQNFESWFNNGSPAGNPTIGNPIELNLGGRGIRDLVHLSNGLYIIIAGNYDDAPLNGAVYRWTGNASDAPVELPSFGITSFNAEAAMEVNEAGTLSLNKLQIITDNGSNNLYGDGVEAKDLAQSTYKKFASEVFVSPITSILPVSFTAFNATRSGNGALLSWKVALPAEVQEFVVERSYNGTHFISIASVQASAAQDVYTYTDLSTAGKDVFYRIKAITKSNSSLYTVIRLVQYNNSWMVKAFPNPVINNTFSLSTSKSGNKQVTVYNNEGAVYSSYQFTGAVQEIGTKEWSKGVYFIKVLFDDQTISTTRVVIP
jgi:hypothetical protein